MSCLTLGTQETAEQGGPALTQKEGRSKAQGSVTLLCCSEMTAALSTTGASWGLLSARKKMEQRPSGRSHPTDEGTANRRRRERWQCPEDSVHQRQVSAYKARLALCHQAPAGQPEARRGWAVKLQTQEEPRSLPAQMS